MNSGKDDGTPLIYRAQMVISPDGDDAVGATPAHTIYGRAVTGRLPAGLTFTCVLYPGAETMDVSVTWPKPAGEFAANYDFSPRT
ncbi:hypothetical protein [Streptomyces sp. NPDC007088]|uniref:hypothetical protein n=1 Tax=Streptomyces sp. NPDC007088 TaxID=3364773 RepID=UPI0036ABF8EC